jgi:hypothetical protein
MILAAAACHPYGDALQGQFNAGSADPFNYPPAYRGGGYTQQVAGSGSFNERKAFAHGAPANYYAFPFPPSLVATTGYAAPIAGTDALKVSAAATPVYQFDPPAVAGTPEQDTTSCKAPPGYAYDPFRDDVHYDRQGNIFAALPAATFPVGGLPTWSYTPLVQRVTLTSHGEACQSADSDVGLLSRSDIQATLDTPAADGTPRAVRDPMYLAWSLIDPGSAVYRVDGTPTTGVGVQHWGWYRQFLVAYLDGGLIPTADTTANNVTTKRMVPQDLYFPRSGVTPTPGSGNGLGGGNELMQFQRGEAGYSPVCRVNSYTLPAGQPVPTDVAALKAAAAANPTLWNLQAGAPVSATGAITPSYIFCLQAQ